MSFGKLVLALIALLLFGSLALYVFRSRDQLLFADERSPGDEEALRQVTEDFGGSIVFDSNPSGTFGIYLIDRLGSTVRPLVDSEFHEMYPDVSPNGEWIVFTRSLSTDRDSSGEIWLIHRDGTQLRKLASSGTFPTFGGDGTTIFFERERKKVVAISFDGSGERELFPAEIQGFGDFQVVKPRISPDGRYLFFTSDRGGRWSAWYADLNTRQAQRIDKGCEPAPFSSGAKVAWITKRNVLAKSAISQMDLKTGERKLLHDEGPPMGHEYFPSLAQGDRFLLYSSCPSGQHDHLTSNYQIFIKDLRQRKVARLTFDAFTNRWPKLLPEQKKAANS